MNEAADDTADMLALQAGDATALDRLMQRWQVRLRSYLLRHALPDQDALDLAQETFVRIFQHADRFDPTRRFSTWMFQIALNLLRDHARRRQRRPTAPLDQVPEPTTGSDPLDDTDSAEVAAAVRAAIATLPDHLREALVLFEYEHQSHAEIAAIVGATPKAVETRLRRAREHLRGPLQRWLAS